MKKLITAFKHSASTWSNKRHMKTLKEDIEKRLQDGGFLKFTQNSKENTKGTEVPFFTLGDFKENIIPVDLIGDPKENILDAGLKAINFTNDTHFLHAIRSKKSSRVKGKNLVRFSLVCEFKPVKQNEDEEKI